MIRIAGSLFLGLLLLASVPAKAGPQDDVREKLEELKRLMELLDDQQGGEEYSFTNSRTSVRVYNVADLTVRLTNYVRPNLELKPAGSEISESQPLFGRADEGEIFFVGVEELMDLVTRNVRPEFWDTGVGRLEYAGPIAFLAVAPPDVLDAIDAFLSGIRESVGRLITVEVHVLPRAEGAPRLPSRMAASQAHALIDGTKDVSARITGFNGQQVSLFRGAQQAFVQDYDVEVAQSAEIGDPIVSLLQSGLSFDVRPTARGDDMVVLNLRGQVSVPDRELRTRGTSVGVVQAPRQGHTEFATTLTVEAGVYATVSAGSRHAVLVSARSERLAAGGGR